jgi:hypothetical protein
MSKQLGDRLGSPGDIETHGTIGCFDVFAGFPTHLVSYQEGDNERELWWMELL